MKKLLLFALLLFALPTFAQIKDSSQMHLWSPTFSGECSMELHDSYFVVLEGYRFPTWHPPRDPSGCSFGHDHAHDPALSPLAYMGKIGFGYLNWKHEQSLPGLPGHRHEDHVGQKVLWGTQVLFTSAGQLPITCDVLVQFHMGTHSPDAFTNNMHGQVQRRSCSNGWYDNVQLLTGIGAPGGFHSLCTGKFVPVGPATPVDSQPKINPLNTGNSFGTRNIIESSCIDGKNRWTVNQQNFELWRTVVVINSPVPKVTPGKPAAGKKAAVPPSIKPADMNTAALQANFYWSTTYPARHYDVATKSMVRTIDSCRAKSPSGAYIVQFGTCILVRNLEKQLGYEISWNDPRSPYRGDVYGMRMTGWTAKNDKSTTVWYTDKDGKNVSAVPFAGSVERVGSVNVWWTNTIGGDARLYEYPGSVRQEMAVMAMPTRVNTTAPLGYSAPGAGTVNSPNGTHAPN